MPNPIDVVEALLFASDVPLELKRITDVLDLAHVAEAQALIDELRARYAERDGGLTISEVGGGFRMVTRPELAPWLVRLARSRTKQRLSRPALETLAIIGYKQPVSRPEVDAVRGVNSEGVLDSLLERRLIRIAGRKEAPGRPYLYETTREFLIAFGLRDIADLPKVDGELVMPEIATDKADGESLPETASESLPGIPTESVAVGESEGGVSPLRSIGGAHAEAETQQDPGAGGTDVTPRG